MDKRIKECIEERAYEIYEWRVANEMPGCALSDWLEAEEEVLRGFENTSQPKWQNEFNS